MIMKGLTQEESFIVDNLKNRNGVSDFKLLKDICGEGYHNRDVFNLLLISLKLKSIITYNGIIPEPSTEITLLKKNKFLFLAKNAFFAFSTHFCFIFILYLFGVILYLFRVIFGVL